MIDTHHKKWHIIIDTGNDSQNLLLGSAGDKEVCNIEVRSNNRI